MLDNVVLLLVSYRHSPGASFRLIAAVSVPSMNYTSLASLVFVIFQHARPGTEVINEHSDKQESL